MARFYTDENIRPGLVRELRKLGHDVLRAFEAGNANASKPDYEVLGFAAGTGRILITYNRRHFLRLHRWRVSAHAGIVVCSEDSDFAAQAIRIAAAVAAMGESTDWLVRVNRPG